MEKRIRSIFRIGALIALLSVFAVFGLYKARDFLGGPQINVESPKNGQVVASSYIDVRGTAKNVSSIFMNGRKIFVDEGGNFKENLLLAMGYNIIEVYATDKFGRSTSEKREVIYK